VALASPEIVRLTAIWEPPLPALTVAVLDPYDEVRP
jgi:hypothetical protein